jgi:hypothetical protein
MISQTSEERMQETQEILADSDKLNVEVLSPHVGRPPKK